MKHMDLKYISVSKLCEWSLKFKSGFVGHPTSYNNALPLTVTH